MPTMDRRHTPRTKLNQVAYIHIEPDNGGIVLNVSGKGLGFHSMVPVERNGALRLSLQEQNRRIDISGELVWTDKDQKIGGVQFSTLSAEARNQILDWTQKSDADGGSRYSLGSALLRALPRTDSPRFAGSFSSAVAWWKSGRGLKVTGFTRGLATGFLLSVIVFSAVFFFYGHRRVVGESLIRLGRRLTENGDSEASARTTNPLPIKVTPPVATRPIIPIEGHSSAVKVTTNRRPAHPDSKPVAQSPVLLPVRAPTSPDRSNPGLDKTHETSLSGASSPASEPSLPMPAAPKLASPVIALSPIPERPASIMKPEPMATSKHIEPAANPGLSLAQLRTGTKTQMFFDLGQFKNELLAQRLSNELAQLGVHATVVPRRRLWAYSYQVLVGPYDNEVAEQQLSYQLRSHGYKLRPFERGTRDFSFRSRVTIDRSPLPTGDFTIAWESYIADAKVKFTQGGDLLAAVDGKWVKHAAKFSQDEYVYQIQADGSRPLLEVHFEGMDRALVFRNLP
jgi:PilZ domain/SPOR domain